MILIDSINASSVDCSRTLFCSTVFTFQFFLRQQFERDVPLNFCINCLINHNSKIIIFISLSCTQRNMREQRRRYEYLHKTEKNETEQQPYCHRMDFTWVTIACNFAGNSSNGLSSHLNVIKQFVHQRPANKNYARIKGDYKIWN